MRYPRVLGALLLLATTADLAPAADSPCYVPFYTVNLRCRDGAACDLDGRCDGSCLLAPFYGPSDRVSASGETDCYSVGRLARHVPLPPRWTSIDPGGWLSPVHVGLAEFWDGRPHGRIRWKCRSARRSCQPAPPAEGTVSVAGPYSPEHSHFSARATAAPSFAQTTEPSFRVYVLGDQAEPEQRVLITVASTLTVGSFPSAVLGAEVRIGGASTAGRPADGELLISAIEPSSSNALVSVVHGTFHGTLTEGTVPVVVDASF